MDHSTRVSETITQFIYPANKQDKWTGWIWNYRPYRFVLPLAVFASSPQSNHCMDITHNSLPHFVHLFHIKTGRGHKSWAWSIARSVLQLDFACSSTKPALLDVGKRLLHSPHWAGCVLATLTPPCNFNYTISNLWVHRSLRCTFSSHTVPSVIYLDVIDSPAAGLAISNQLVFQNEDYHGFLAPAFQVLPWPTLTICLQ